MNLHLLLETMFVTRIIYLSRQCSAFKGTTGRIGVRRNAGMFSNERIYHCGPIYSASSTSNNQSMGKEIGKKKKKEKKKIKVNPITTGDEEDLLTAAFAELAREEGFDDTLALYADDSTLDEDFVDDFLDFSVENKDDDMDRRLAEAKRDTERGRITVPEELDELSQNEINFRKLGFKPELNPFGDDETLRKDEFLLVTNALTCSACGSDFQCSNESRPGFLPREKFDIQVKLSKLEKLQNLKLKSEKDNEWSAEDEIEYLLHGEDDADKDNELADIDIDKEAEVMGLDVAKLSKKKVVCKRCHGLQNFGKVEEILRPGWTEEPQMSQSKFRALLKPLREKPAVIIALVDLFDFAGSVLTELDNIAGENPVILAANKADLLPSKMGQHRAENWVRRELEYLGVQSIANIGGAVRLVSCKTGFGISDLLVKARKLGEEMNSDVYVVGAANAGKSTLVNYILERNSKEKSLGKKRAGNVNANKGAVTVSPLPGTTLKFIKVDLGDKRSLYDTPGLLVPGTLTQMLTPEELKIVVPRKKVEPITFRVTSGKCVLVGGLARVGIIGDSKPFLLTFFVANDIKLHPTDSDKADHLIENHVGKMLTPPLEKRENIEWEHHDIAIDGAGWKEAAADITLRGLGWVAVTGAGKASLRVTVPKGIGVAVRPPLMPFDVWDVASRYTGGKAVRKVTKKKYGSKRRKGVGRN